VGTRAHNLPLTGIYKGNFVQFLAYAWFNKSEYFWLYTFSKDSTHSFINKTPDRLVSVFALYFSVKLSSIICWSCAAVKGLAAEVLHSSVIYFKTMGWLYNGLCWAGSRTPSPQSRSRVCVCVCVSTSVHTHRELMGESDCLRKKTMIHQLLPKAFVPTVPFTSK